MNVAATQGSKLEVRSACKVYGDLVALEDCSLRVAPREIVSIVGPSGCGKTTLLWSMSGLHHLSSGDVLLDGTPVTGPHRDIGLVFQEANLLPWRDLRGNLMFPFEIKRQKPDWAWIEHLLERVGLVGFEASYPRELSGGMQQRASMVRALALKPSVLLMDEPFGALDAFTREEMNQLVEEVWMEVHKTIVFITHSIEEAVFLSDRVLVMTGRPGRICNDYAVDLPRPRTPDVMASHAVFALMNAIKRDIYAGRARPARAASGGLRRAG